MNPDPPRPPARTSVAVLPFVNAGGDPDDDYFGEGIAEEITRALAELTGLRVAAQSSAFSFKGSAEAPADVAKRLGVEALLQGRVLKSGHRVRVAVELTKPATSTVLWAEEFDRELTDVFSVQREITATIARRFRLTLGVGEESRLARAATGHHEAWDLYLRGRFVMGMRGEANLRKALEYFERALALDPDFASAHTGVAHMLGLLSMYGFSRPHDVMPRSRAAAERAIALNESEAEAHVALAFALMTYAWDWNGAEREYRRALELNPNDPTALAYYGMYYLMGIQDRIDEGFELIWRAAEIDPLAPLPVVILSAAGYYSGRTEGILARVHDAAEAQPSFWLLQRALGLSLASLGRNTEALAALERAVQLSHGFHWNVLDLGILRAQMGDAREALSLHGELEAMARERFLQPMALAAIPAALGRADEALSQLRIALEERDSILFAIRHYPAFRPLHHDPRFAAIVAEMGLPPLAR